MRLTRLIPALAMSLLLIACERGAVTAPDPPQFSMHEGSAPIEFPFTSEFPAVNPCTGLGHIVTWTGTGWFQPHPNNAVLRFQFAIATTDGYAGSGNDVWMGTDGRPGDVLKRTVNTLLTHPSGSRLMVHLVMVIDFKNSPPIAHVDRLEPICVAP